MLTFDQEKHEYKLDGIIVPSVTQIIQAAGLFDFSDVNPDLLERSANFGTAVHKCIELMCKGTLDVSSVDESIEPYLSAWTKFCLDYSYKSNQQEYRAANSALRVGFTIDNVGFVKTVNQYIVDIKTGNPKPSDIVQACAYGYLYPVPNIMLLYLKEEEYKTVIIKGIQRKKGENTFLSCLNVYNFKKEHKLI